MMVDLNLIFLFPEEAVLILVEHLDNIIMIGALKIQRLGAAHSQSSNKHSMFV